MIVLRLVPGSDTGSTFKLEWDPVPDADGYRFYSAGVLRSKTMDPNRTTIKFSKGQAPYEVEAVKLVHLDSGTYPSSTPTGIKVAPLVAYEEDGSNARFCFFNPDGSLRPGVVKQADGTYRDAVGWYDANGLQKGSERNEKRDPNFPQIVGAREINGRPLCELPMAGSPTANTGSWRV